MSQSSYIAGGLVLGFLMFLAARGRLNTYGQALFGASPSQPTAKSKDSGIGGTVSDVLDAGKTIASVAAFL